MKKVYNKYEHFISFIDQCVNQLQLSITSFQFNDLKVKKN